MRWFSKTPTEHQEQKTVIEWAEAMRIELPEAGLIFAIPNGGMRPQTVRYNRKGRMVRYSAEGRKLREEGTKAGVPDLFLPVSRQEWKGLFIELKTKTGSVSLEQQIWIGKLTVQKYAVTVCRGADEAIDTIKRYLTDPSWAPSKRRKIKIGKPAKVKS